MRKMKPSDIFPSWDGLLLPVHSADSFVLQASYGTRFDGKPYPKRMIKDIARVANDMRRNGYPTRHYR